MTPTRTITLIPGDGIGPEVTEAVVRILAGAGVAIDWDTHDAGLLAFQRVGASLPHPASNSTAKSTGTIDFILQPPCRAPASYGIHGR